MEKSWCTSFKSCKIRLWRVSSSF
nr:unnamed protein product [Callosobruchus analis]CAI5859384.1 unnamed protein product [Callosobruchus analis]